MKPDNALTIGYLSKHPDNAARVLENLPLPMTSDLLEQLAPEQYLATFEYLVPAYAAKLLETLREDARGKLMNALSTEKLSLLLTFFSDSGRKDMLSQIPTEKRKKVISRMQYPRDSVGAIMQPPSFTLPQDISIAEALKRIQSSKHLQFPEVIVLDKTHHYIGLISLNKMLQASPQKKLRSITSSKIAALPARKSLKNLTENPAWAFSRVLPVTDVQGLLIGVLDYATLLQNKTMEMPQGKYQEVKQSSALDLLFQTLAVPIEVLVIKLFPYDKAKNTTRNRRHDNGV